MAQSQIVNKLTDAVTELTGSFLDNPSHHSNTVKISNLAQQFRSSLDDLYMQVPLEAEADFNCIMNMRNIIKCLDFVTANIAGYSRGGIDATVWDTLFNPIMTGFGWSWEIIHSTNDIVFYEYKKDNFKMVLAKNIRPKKNGDDYNANSFSCYTWQPIYKEYYAFISRIVFGGNYQFVEYGDDETEYKKISKVSSKRGNHY